MADGDLNHLLSKRDQTEEKKDSGLVMLKRSPEVNVGWETWLDLFAQSSHLGFQISYKWLSISVCAGTSQFLGLVHSCLSLTSNAIHKCF